MTHALKQGTVCVKRLREVEDDRDYWRTYAKQLEEALAPDVLPLQISMRLTRSEARMLSALVAHDGICRYERLILAVWGDSEPLDDPMNCVKVFACKLRQKLAPLGIRIVTKWGEGYALPPASREIIDRMQNARRAA